ncbi:MAG: radical SAM protein [Desulfobacteraceae bacterium]|nr:radical SAM protein [Desulfobacteraceae bacterium]
MHKSNWLTAVAGNEKGDIFDLPGFAAVGGNGPLELPLTVSETCSLPHGGELMYLPGRAPLVYDLDLKQVVVLEENPYEPGERLFPVAAFNSPGYVITHTCAWQELADADHLPLFSYSAVGWNGDQFRVPLVQVDNEPRQDLRQMPVEKVLAGVKQMQKKMPGNRLRKHLEGCALKYGCPAGKNFFLGRYEAPLPSSAACNASCLGCLSLQSEGCISQSQDRISFTPTADEIAQVALAHIERVKKAVVSFGQGCEGDPLMVSDLLVSAIGKIRKATSKGTINLNTNGSLPEKIEQLINAGLDSMRVSMNSIRKACYTAYFRPKGYCFEDAVKSIDLARSRNVHVSINYLNCPGFTDSPAERDALLDFIKDHPFHMIQWRNLNFDPVRYLKIMNEAGDPGGNPVGMRVLLDQVRQMFPHIRYGYFNPAKETFQNMTK